MKTFFILMTLMFTLNLSANELSWVNEQVEAIKPPRAGMKRSELSALKDPFIFLKKNEKETTSSTKKTKKTFTATPLKRAQKEASLSLTMLMNTSALINGKWYKVGDRVHGYRLSKIDAKSVLLSKHNKKRLLTTSSKTKNLNFNNK